MAVPVSRLTYRLRKERDNERGIALQTIIIIVVLLAIAGTVATVLFTRAGTETDRLEGRDRPLDKDWQRDRLRNRRRGLGRHASAARQATTAVATATATAQSAVR